MHGHGVQQLVGQHHTSEAPLRQLRQPGHPVGDRRHLRLQGFALALTQACRQLENKIAVRQLLPPGQLGEDTRSHGTGAGARLQKVPAADLFQQLGALTGDTMAE